VLEADKRGGLFSGVHDALNRFTVSHDGVEHRDWNAEVDAWVRQLVDSHASHGQYGAPYGQGYAHHDGHDGHGHDGQHRSGPSTGAVVAGVAAGVAVGVVGGIVAAEVVDEIGDAFEDEEEDD
ncbi:sporulation protein, partial [Streptomyces sp. 2MCAF27]